MTINKIKNIIFLIDKNLGKNKKKEVDDIFIYLNIRGNIRNRRLFNHRYKFMGFKSNQVMNKN